MAIQWVTGFFDFPAGEFEAGRDFWLGVTGYAVSPPRGPRGDFATLVPGGGDAYLRVQRIYDGSPGCHLDFHAADWAGLAARADGLGARRVLTTRPGPGSRLTARTARPGPVAAVTRGAGRCPGEHACRPADRVARRGPRAGR